MGVLASALGRRHLYNCWRLRHTVGNRVGRWFIKLLGYALNCAVMAVDNGTDCVAKIAQQMPTI